MLNPTQRQPFIQDLGVAMQGGASMRKAISCLVPTAIFAMVLCGCGSGMGSMPARAGTNLAQVSLTIHDSAPMGVTVLTFEIEVTGATLQPSDSSSKPV